ncbi:MAG: site-specific DNA-methyltransferase [Chloroflexota bacterium]|nr:site-specific DNA-methyltransferase [Chloroflexota bacterium]
MESLLVGTDAQTLLDPFSGSGTAPLTAGSLGMDATGIELMPIGNLLAGAISAASNGLKRQDFLEAADGLLEALAGEDYNPDLMFPHVPITEHAFPDQTERDLAKAREFMAGVADHSLRSVLTLACVSILEEISYTRKDGQFLRWDPQSGRDVKPKLHKASLPTLGEALSRRIGEMADDLAVLKDKYGGTAPEFIEGSSLYELQRLPDNGFDVVVTSPPYANRYDYTRIYALELAYMGYDAARLKELRQVLLSATVENRSKREQLQRDYGQTAKVSQALEMADGQTALQEALGVLNREAKNLSNRNVIDLVENYFTEMALVVIELGRLVPPGGHVYMVNDNVRYHGEEVPVDLILSDFAEQSGFRCESIWTLNRGKGNSSQQMGRFGRKELRKCVYHWRKSDG